MPSNEAKWTVPHKALKWTEKVFSQSFSFSSKNKKENRIEIRPLLKFANLFKKIYIFCCCWCCCCFKEKTLTVHDVWFINLPTKLQYSEYCSYTQRSKSISWQSWCSNQLSCRRSCRFKKARLIGDKRKKEKEIDTAARRREKFFLGRRESFSSGQDLRDSVWLCVRCLDTVVSMHMITISIYICHLNIFVGMWSKW